jgi:hypothetical protein
MISSVNSSTPVTYQPAQPARSQPPAKQSETQAQDSVQLSSAAKTTGDANHDGDSK